MSEWRGSPVFRDLLVPVDSLEPFAGNPRRGDTQAVAASLERFGQLKPVVVDGSRIVAGHHVVEAARLLGWTEVAVASNDFGSEDEQRAFLLADNRTSELGDNDIELLAAQLRELEEIDSLTGTGYSRDDLDQLLADIANAANGTSPSPLAGNGTREKRDPQMKELVLIYSVDQLAQVEEWMGRVAAREGTQGTSETVYAALEHAAG